MRCEADRAEEVYPGRLYTLKFKERLTNNQLMCYNPQINLSQIINPCYIFIQVLLKIVKIEYKNVMEKKRETKKKQRKKYTIRKPK